MWIWNWVGELKPAQAAIVAAVLGFLTLAFGHIFNSHLNRKRDKFLIEMERLSLLRAMTIEISQIVRLVRLQSKQFGEKQSIIASYSAINPLTFAVVYHNNLSGLHKVPPECLKQIIPFYIGLQEHEYNLVTSGVFKVGDNLSLQSFTFSSSLLGAVISGNRNIDMLGEMALAACYPVVQSLEKKLEGRSSPRKRT